MMSGNPRTDLTDHLPNCFVIVSNRSKRNADCLYVGLYSDENILQLKSKLNNINWEHIYDYDYFDSKVKECNNGSFNPLRLSRKRSRDKSAVYVIRIHFLRNGLLR